MASSFKCPWGVKARFTIPFKSLFYYHADKGLVRLAEGDDCVLIRQICYFKGHAQHRGVSLNHTYCILQDDSLESYCRAFDSRRINTLREKTIE